MENYRHHVGSDLAESRMFTWRLLLYWSLGGSLTSNQNVGFGARRLSASFLWFFGLAILAAWLAPRLRTAKSQRIINLVVGCVMWFIALQLARDGIAHAQALFS
ncbi:LysE family transporter [Shigella flexneri]